MEAWPGACGDREVNNWSVTDRYLEAILSRSLTQWRESRMDGTGREGEGKMGGGFLMKLS